MSYLGGKIVLIPEWNTDEAVCIIKREKVCTISGASQAMIRALIDSNCSGDQLESVTNINIHGAALHPAFIRVIMEKLPNVTLATGYGMTETC